jgi:2-polyprenyl-3-methyl-5-hydroxy-6-metoxy-1,4-benzoquinol methylase
MLRRLGHFFRRTLLRPLTPGLPRDGFTPGGPAPRLDGLSDRDLDRLNKLLPWMAFTVDAKGRRFGNLAWKGKRTEPQVIPDRRIELLDQEFGLADKTVLEIGCFEGIHTIGLARKARSVIAVDARIDNVVKTIVRASLHGCSPVVQVCNVEEYPLPVFELRSDIVHHVGVLYHLKDPVAHLRAIAGLTRVGLMLDTHFARPEQADKSYTSVSRAFKFRNFEESGEFDPFSGMYSTSKWLLLDDMISLLKEGGFESVRVVEEREERNGPRVLLFARKPPSGAAS